MSEIYTVKTRGIGLPDYAQPKPVGSVPVGPIYTSTDIAELAARQGSPVTFDRRGNVIWYDDFGSSLNKWVIGGVGATCVITNAYARARGLSALLTTGGGLGDIATMQHAEAYPTLSKMGFEFSFDYDGNVCEIRLGTHLYNGTTEYYPFIRWNQPDNDLSYGDETGALVHIAFEELSDVAFNTMKLVVDFETNQYVRLLLNNLTYDLSGKGIPSTPDAVTLPQLLLTPRLEALVVGVVGVFVDDVIITQNEPANVGE